MARPYRSGGASQAGAWPRVDRGAGIRPASVLPARKRPSALRHGLWAVCLVSCSSTPGWAGEPAVRPAERRPDAVEVVQEGNVELWLQHYQRERGEEWERASERKADSPSLSSPPMSPPREPTSPGQD